MSGRVRLTMKSELGEIELEVDAARAPITASNFLYYVDNDFYDGGRFWRTVTPHNQAVSDVPIEVIQGGVNPDRVDEIGEPISLERTSITGLSHVDGAISMGRFAPDSAHSEFFICIGDQPELNYGGSRNPDGQGFAAFGCVLSGMDVVRRIQRSAHEGQLLTPAVKILEIRRSVKYVNATIACESNQ